MDDLRIAQLYVSKAGNAKSRGIEFSLPFTAFRNIMRAKYCYFSNIELTDPRPGQNNLETDRTVDRIDSSKGYVAGNCCATAYCVNNWKGGLENPTCLIKPEMAEKILKKLKKRMTKTRKEGDAK